MLIRPLNFTQKDLCATSDKNSNFNISKTLQFSSLFSNSSKGHTYTKPMIRLPRACRGRTAVRFPATSSHMCCRKLALDRQLCTHLGSKRFLRRGFSPFINPANGFVSLVDPHKGETAVFTASAIWLWVGICVPLALNLHYFQCNRIKFHLFFINYCIS